MADATPNLLLLITIADATLSPLGTIVQKVGFGKS
jgi:hypothetical protein